MDEIFIFKIEKNCMKIRMALLSSLILLWIRALRISFNKICDFTNRDFVITLININIVNRFVYLRVSDLI